MLLKLTVLCLVFGIISTNSVPVVHTKLGIINGKSITVEFKDKAYTINRYAGLRYAKAPAGELRFQKPVPYGNFESPLDALDFTSSCPQNEMMNLGVDSVDEDCLSLNIYVPTEKPDRPEGFAVMIFVHGGGFAIGAGQIYHSEVLAGLGNVIVVTINYRLGLLGFANSGDGQVVGNFALWDQKMAFQWVKDNIESFGGDVSRITIFGESAGGISVMIQGLDPTNKGLFQAVIAQSGTPSMPFRLAADNSDNMEYIAAKLGCMTESSKDVVDCLKTVQTSDLMAMMAELSKDVEGSAKVQFMPTIEGDLIKRPFFYLIEESRQGKTNEQIDFFRSLNLINGVNTAEGALFLMLLGQEDFENIVMSKDEFASTHVPNVVNLFLNYEQRAVPKPILDVIAYEYTEFENLCNVRHGFVNLISDIFFTVPGREWLDVHANSTTSNTYFYSFDADLKANPIPTPSWIKGANHGDEILPVFGYFMSSLEDLGVLMNQTDYKPPDLELNLSERMMTYWANFAKTGDPNDGSPTVTELLRWPQLDTDDTNYIVFNDEDSIRHDNIYARALEFWREIVPALWDALNDVSCHAKESPFSKKATETCDADGNCD